MAGIDSTYETYEKMQDSVMNWGKLLIASGGSYKPPKCFYHLISFKWLHNGKWEYEDNHGKAEYEMRVPMPDGTSAKIDYLPVIEAKKTLGVWTSPVGSSVGALTDMKEKAQEWIDKAKKGRLRRRDIWFLLEPVLAKGGVWALLQHGNPLRVGDMSVETIFSADPVG